MVEHHLPLVFVAEDKGTLILKGWNKKYNPDPTFIYADDRK